MTIISATVCDKSGEILLSRQYSHITKHQLEESIRNFPRLIEANQQHTFVETEYVRYLYLPLDSSLYLVLLTKKHSNIIEDQETIRLLSKIVQELCKAGVTEDAVIANNFDIVLSFDDVVSYGMRESVTLSQVQSSLEMESADERLHLMMMKQKQAEQKEAAKRHQLEVSKRKSAGGADLNNGNSFSSASYRTGDSSNYASSSATGHSSSFSHSSKNEVLATREEVYVAEDKPQPPQNQKATSIAPKKGMVLGKKAKAAAGGSGKESQESLKLQVQKIAEQVIVEQAAATTAVTVNPLQAPVEIEVIEKFSCSVSREGVATNLDVNGEIFLLFRDPSKCRAALQFEHESELKMAANKPHINLNKNLWLEKKQIVLKNIETAFPVNTRIPSVKYRYASVNAAKDIPFTVTCWFNEGELALEVEFNAEQKKIHTICDLTITFELPAKEATGVQVQDVENGSYEVDQKLKLFKYVVPILSASQPSSNIQITLSKTLAEDDIYPLNVDFELPYTFFNIKPLAVADLADNNALLKFEYTKKCRAEKYTIN